MHHLIKPMSCITLSALLLALSGCVTHTSNTNATLDAAEQIFASKTAKPEEKFQTFMKLMKEGYNARVVIDYKKCDGYYLKTYVENPKDIKNPEEETSNPNCKLSQPKKPAECYTKDKGMDAIGSMLLQTWEYFGPEITKNWPDKRTYVASSTTELISLRGFVYNYGNVRIYDDGTVKVSVNYLDKNTLEVKMDEYFICSAFLPDAAVKFSFFK